MGWVLFSAGRPWRRGPAAARLRLEELERREVPATFLRIVETPNYVPTAPAQSTCDVLSVTVAGKQYQYAGVQVGVKLADSPGALPGDGKADFYTFCVDLEHEANLSSPYEVTTARATSLSNGAAIAYLYDTFNTPVGQPLDRTHAAALQLAIWEAGHGGAVIVTRADRDAMNARNGAAETDRVLDLAARYLVSVPCHPHAGATVLVSSPCNGGPAAQTLLGPACLPSKTGPTHCGTESGCGHDKDGAHRAETCRRPEGGRDLRQECVVHHPICGGIDSGK
jgi:hypothetical protein